MDKVWPPPTRGLRVAIKPQAHTYALDCGKSFFLTNPDSIQSKIQAGVGIKIELVLRPITLIHILCS